MENPVVVLVAFFHRDNDICSPIGGVWITHNTCNFLKPVFDFPGTVGSAASHGECKNSIIFYDVHIGSAR